MTYEALPECRGPKGDPCAGMDLNLMAPFYAVGWLLAAVVLVAVVQTMLRKRTGAGLIIGLGCGFWVLLWIAIGLLGLRGGGFAVVLVPIIAFGLAGAIAERWTRPDE